jgi:hypothetical protein
MNKQLSEQDREEIAQAVERFGRTNRLVSSKIVRIKVEDDGRVVISAGIQKAPRLGGGDTLEAIRMDGGSEIKRVGFWRS